MSPYKRYAVFAVPHGCFYAKGAAWLGWDSVAGCQASHPDVAGLAEPIATLTARPRDYGFHGTIKAPFQLAETARADDLAEALAGLCSQHAPVEITGLKLQLLGRFAALVAEPPSDALGELAGNVVIGLDRFRAPMTQAEADKRQNSRLTPRHRTNLETYGYPYVLNDFRFHLTLTGPIAKDATADVTTVLAAHFAPVIPCPFVIRDLVLMGEDARRRFHVIKRIPLSG